jgi:hypothetical protein
MIKALKEMALANQDQNGGTALVKIARTPANKNIGVNINDTCDKYIRNLNLEVESLCKMSKIIITKVNTTTNTSCSGNILNFQLMVNTNNEAINRTDGILSLTVFLDLNTGMIKGRLIMNSQMIMTTKKVTNNELNRF